MPGSEFYQSTAAGKGLPSQQPCSAPVLLAWGPGSRPVGETAMQCPHVGRPVPWADFHRHTAGIQGEGIPALTTGSGPVVAVGADVWVGCCVGGVQVLREMSVAWSLRSPTTKTPR